MNEQIAMKKAARPIEKNLRVQRGAAKIRHLQKQRKLWMASKVEWHKPSIRPELGPSSRSQHTFLEPQHLLATVDSWSSYVA